MQCKCGGVAKRHDLVEKGVAWAQALHCKSCDRYEVLPYSESYKIARAVEAKRAKVLEAQFDSVFGR